MDEEKLSFPVQETGGEPRVADRETQTDDNTVKVNVRVWQNNVDQKTSDSPIDNRAYLQRSVHLDYSNRRRSAASLTREHPPNSPSIAKMTPQNLEDQATGFSANPWRGATDNVNVSRVMECQENLFLLLVQDTMKQLPQEKKITCMKEVLDVVFKHALMHSATSAEVPTPPRNNP